MKLVILIFLSVLYAELIPAQTPEQKKQMKEAQRKADSITNLPHIKKMMKDAKAKEAEFAKLEKERKAKENTKVKKKAIPKDNKKAGDFYWRNTIASNNQGKFSNWKYGSAYIRAGFYDRKTRMFIYLPFGSITNEGQLNIKLPSIEEQTLPFKPITTPYSEGDAMFSYKHLNFTNPGSKWISTRFSLEVHQGDKTLGYLKIGNAIKPVVNLNSPCCTGKAGDGYSMFWVYVSDNINVSGETGSSTGGKVVHNLSFKQGWNLIKIEVTGLVEDKDYNQELWKDKTITGLTSLPNNAKYFFMKY